MQKLIVVFVFIWIIIAGKAQIIIQGKVLDNNSGLPVANASVYLNNTTYGTNTNNEGGFLLSVGSIFTGELIVSSAGHEPLSYKLNSNDADKKLYVFKLEVKEKILNGVLIVNNATRQIWLKLFKENFLGITEEAENCTIENLDAIYFTADENIIYAYADTTLIITNKLLGYNIAFDLVEFYFDINKRSAYCLGFTRYGEMEGSKKYIKGRKQNYYGSTKHFYRSLINKELDAEGFSMFEIKKIIDDKDSGKNERIPISNEEPVLAMPIGAINILFIDNISNEYYLQFSNRIMVQFVRNPRRKHYYTTENVNDRGSNDFNFTAYIDLLTDKVEVDTKGIIRNPLAIEYNGFWKFEKLANQLPFDYQPD